MWVQFSYLNRLADITFQPKATYTQVGRRPQAKAKGPSVGTYALCERSSRKAQHEVQAIASAAVCAKWKCKKIRIFLQKSEKNARFSAFFFILA